MQNSAALITAAGSGTRMGGSRKKEYLLLEEKPVLLHILEAFEKTGLFSWYVVTVPREGTEEAKQVLSGWLETPSRAERTRFVEGSDTRRKSVYAGLSALESLDPDIVLIHDGARPWASSDLIRAVHGGVVSHGACVPVLPAVDAMKQTGEDGFIRNHLERSITYGAQTPQGFLYRKIIEAHRKASEDGREYVDDTEIYDAYAGRVFTVPGERINKKITYPEDLTSTPEINKVPPRGGFPRIGFGYDLHRLTAGRKLLLGGVELPSPVGEEGHSDGDVLIHAVIDALFGAARLGDIGYHFPPSDDRYKDISSRILLRRAGEILSGEGWRVGNMDCTVVLEKPKILPFRERIIENLAADLSVDPGVVSVKGKTKEKVDAVGEGKAVEAYVSILLFR